MPTLSIHRYSSPMGLLYLVHDGVQLRALDFDGYDARLDRLLRQHYGVYALKTVTAPASIGSALDAYFEGDLHAIDDIPVATGGTEFQRCVWRALRDIPAGQTISYGTLAARIGKPLAVRAVGLANGANPLGIVVPCHRVIGANGSLTGYGGGLDRKRWLLAHEGRAERPTLFDLVAAPAVSGRSQAFTRH